MPTLSEPDVIACVRAAIMAPSTYNTQPWFFVPRSDGIEVHADLSRQLAAVDPRRRGLYLSLGAAILNIRLALAERGYHSRTEFLPDGTDAGHAATVTADGRQTVPTDDLELFTAISRRHSNREPFDDIPPPRDALDQMVAAAREEGGILAFAEPQERDALLGLIRTADSRLLQSSAYRSELRSWTTDDPYREDGVPVEAVGPWSLFEAVPIRDLAPDRELPQRASERFEQEPTLATLAVPGGDGYQQWLRAGQAMQRVLLEATRLGLATSLFTQPLDVPALRDLLTDADHLSAVHVILRVGYGHPVVASPRRPVEEVIVRPGPAGRRQRHRSRSLAEHGEHGTKAAHGESEERHRPVR